MPTKFNDYMAIPENKWKVLSRLNVFRSSIDGELYIEEKDPAATGGDVNIAGPFGQEQMAASLPVTIASDQSAIPISNTGFLSTNSLVPVAFDNIAVNLAGATADVYTYKVAAATVATVTINYVDATKAVISTIVRT